MLARDFSFEVPSRLIAQRPPARRGGERLLVLDRARAGNRHATMAELPDLLPAGSVLACALPAWKRSMPWTACRRQCGPTA